MTAPKFPRVFFSVHLVRQLPIPGKKRKAEVQNLGAACASVDFGSYPAAVPVGGKNWKGDVDCIWNEQNLFSSKRQWEVLFYFPFFSSLMGLCIQIFLYCHLNWIDRDNLLFFNSWKKDWYFCSPDPPQISWGWAAFPQQRGAG